MPKDVSAVAIGTVGVGLVVLWSGVRGASIVKTAQELAQGRKPSGENVHNIERVGGAAGSALADSGIGLAGAGNIVAMAQQVADSPAGRANYCWGGGHTGSPCSAKCFDCSGYVSCVLNKLGLMRGSMTTLGFLAWRGAVRIPWEQRAPGDLLVNAGHMGIAVDGSRMLNARCTACGPVQISPYKKGEYTVLRVRG